MGKMIIAGMMEGAGGRAVNRQLALLSNFRQEEKREDLDLRRAERRFLLSLHVHDIALMLPHTKFSFLRIFRNHGQAMQQGLAFPC
jgi:hypothetical protein